MTRFRDRRHAAELLRDAITPALRGADPILYALPRGGVPLAALLARAWQAPLDLVLVRKVGMPGQPELALGAVAEIDEDSYHLAVNEELCRAAGISLGELEVLADRQHLEIARRRALYFGARPRPALEGRDAVLVDDGVATGATMRAALEALRRRGPRHVLVAVPVAPPEVLEQLARAADDVVCLAAPDDFRAVGRYYDDFGVVEDDDVQRLLA